MKTILLPTDLSIQSLYPVHDIVKEANGESLEIIVVHFLSLSTSISDLLTTRDPYSEIPGHFTEAYQSLRNKYQDVIGKLTFKFVYCNTTRYLNNFIEGNNVSTVYLLENYTYGTPLKNSVALKNYFAKCKVKVIHISLHSEATSSYHILSPLLVKQERPAKTAVAVAQAEAEY